MIDEAQAMFLLNISFLKLIGGSMTKKNLSIAKKHKEEETIIIKKFTPTNVVWRNIGEETRNLQKKGYFVLPPKLFMTAKDPVLVLIAIKKDALQSKEVDTLIKNELQKNDIPLQTEQEKKQPTLPPALVPKKPPATRPPISLAPNGPIELPSAVSGEDLRPLATPKKTKETPQKPFLKPAEVGQSSSSFKVIRGRGWLAFKGTITERSAGGVEIQRSDSDFSENNKGYVRIPVKAGGRNIYALYLGKKYLQANSEPAEKENTRILSDSAKKTILEEVKKHINDKNGNEQKQILGVIKEILDKLKIIRGEKGWKLTTK